MIGVIALLFLANMYLGCSKDSSNSDYINNADCTGVDADNNTYTKSIKSILDANCATSGCHNAATQENNLDLSSYAAAKSGFESQECLCSIHHGSGCNPMPKGGSKLSDAEIQQIDCWAKNGYKQ